MNRPALMNDLAAAWREERRVLELRIAELQLKLATAEYDKAMLLKDAERLRRELDDAQGVIR